MTDFKKISPAALIALKEALTHIYWTRNDLRKFVEFTIKNKTIVSTIDWQGNVKFESISQLIDRMTARPDIFQEDLLYLFNEVASFSDFTHLKRWEDSEIKIKTAQEKVAALRKHAHGHFELLKKTEEIEKRRVKAEGKRSQSIDYQNKLNSLKEEFIQMSVSKNPQGRGYQFEKFLNDLFIFFDLDPKTSFKISGEQIDGAFTFDNTDYLLEAKWQQGAINAGDLYKFAGKLSGKLKNTLGLYISMGVYSPECTEVDAPGIKSMILMDGADLFGVLDNRITLPDLLYRKRRHASRTGEIYLKIDKIL
jgi:hypothetical protein